jgi:biopolymer transport protein TolR
MAFDGGNSGSTDSIAAINVTPLVDVMLVLLVIFMVTAPIIQQGVSVDLPKVAGGPLATQEAPLVVSVDRAGRFSLANDVLSLADLTTRLRTIAAAKPNQQIYVRADQAVPYGQVMRAMGALRDAGLVRVGLVTEPPPEPAAR